MKISAAIRRTPIASILMLTAVMTYSSAALAAAIRVNDGSACWHDYDAQKRNNITINCSCVEGGQGTPIPSEVACATTCGGALRIDDGWTSCVYRTQGANGMR